MLIRVFGITLYATSTIVAVFMGGLALGSWFIGRRLERREPSLRLYAAIEIAAASTSLIATLAISQLPGFFQVLAAFWELPQWGASSPLAASVRLLLTALVLVVPTALMGTTLPILVRIMTHRTGEIGRRLGLMYGLNTLGAVVGVLSAGFVTIAALGETGSILLGVLVNLGIGGFVWIKADPRKPLETPREPTAGPVYADHARRLLLLAAASGFCALAYEVLWTRLLILLLGSSVYAFSTMLSTYLLGIGIGSLVISRFVDKIRDPLVGFGWSQALLGLTSAASLHLYGWLGRQASDPKYLYSPLQTPGDLLRFAGIGLVVILPVTLLLGAIFPFLGRALVRKPEEAGAATGRLYAWNTVGGVLGSLAAGVWLLPLLGAQGAFAGLSLVNFIIGVAALGFAGLFKSRMKVAVLAVAAGVLALGLPIQRPLFLEIIGGRIVSRGLRAQVLFHQDEVASAVTGLRTYRGPDNSNPSDMLLLNGIIISGEGAVGSLMAHIPLLMREAPKNMLVVCFGVGTTFMSAIQHVGKVDAVELVRGVVDGFSFFEDKADSYLNAPEVRVFINDGRNHMLLSRDNYDAIIVDGSPPIFAPGTVNLYSLEFLKLARERLTPQGIMTLWVPTPCFERDFWMIARNFTEVYPHLAVWAHPSTAGILIMGSMQPFDASPEAFQKALQGRKHGQVPHWIRPELYTSAWRLNDAEIRAMASRYPLVTDDRPRTEFPLDALFAGKKLWRNGGFLPKAMMSK